MAIRMTDIEAGRVAFSGTATGRRLPPTHPGRILRLEFLDPLGVTPYRLAKDIGVPLTRIAAILAERRAITGDTALRLGRYFGIEAQFWVNLQGNFEIEVARRALGSRLDAIKRRAA
jgi:addiction module HigA family antidote